MRTAGKMREARNEIEGELALSFEVVGGMTAAGLVVLCDHAENTLPAAYGTLGLAPPELERHIAYDIGAAAVVREIAAGLGVPAVLSRFSRLLIDPNRGLDDPTLIMRVSDGAIVPGNRRIDAVERERRVADFYLPYHGAVSRTIDAAIAAGKPPALLSIHSFTPEMQGVVRPWHAAVLWDKDPRLALPLLGALGQEPGLVVGNNEPYSGHLMGDCMWTHGTMRGLPHAIVEVRQDLIRHADGQREWGVRLARIAKAILADGAAKGDLNVIRHFGSHADIEEPRRL